jgi:hypothetical protein
VLNDSGYEGVDPRLPWLDLFVLQSAGLLPGGRAGAFVRAGLHRSFTAKRVCANHSMLPFQPCAMRSVIILRLYKL